MVLWWGWSILRGGEGTLPPPQDHLEPKVGGKRGEPDTLSQPVDPSGVGGLIEYVRIVGMLC